MYEGGTNGLSRPLALTMSHGVAAKQAIAYSDCQRKAIAARRYPMTPREVNEHQLASQLTAFKCEANHIL